MLSFCSGLYIECTFTLCRNIPVLLTLQPPVSSTLAWWLLVFYSWLQAQHTRYGPIVRIGPDRLSFIQSEAWKDIYGHRSGGRQANVKDPRFYDEMDLDGHRNVLTERDGTEHGRLRRIFSHAFSDKALKEQQPLLDSYVNQLVSNIRRALDEDPNHEFDAVKLYNFTTFDIMADLAFGESLGMLRTSNYTDWVRNIFDSTRILAISTIWREYGWLNRLYKLLEPPFMRKATEAHFAHSADRVKRRLEQGDRADGRKDIWTLVLSQPEGKGLTPEKMYSNASIFMLAGTETTEKLCNHFRLDREIVWGKSMPNLPPGTP